MAATSGAMPRFGKGLIGFLCLTFLCAPTTLAIHGCGNSFTGNRGNFTSPGYPDHYSGQKGVCTDIPESCNGCSSQCVWTVTVPGEDSVVELTMENVEFKNFQSLFCCADFIEVRDGSDSSSTLLATICNSTSPTTFLSTGKSLFVRLVSTTDVAFFGRNEVKFQASWSTGCHKILTDQSGVVQSRGFPAPYREELDCTFLIKQKRGYRVTIDFTSFSLDPENIGICHDYLTVYDGTSDQDPVLGGPYCGTTLPGKLNSTNNTVFFKFHTDSKKHSPTNTGFQLNYARSALECKTWDLNDEKGEIMSPGFPDPFPEEGQCVWYIYAPDGSYVIDLTVNEVNLGSDTNVLLDCTKSEGVTSELAVYDGEDGPLLERYCTRNIGLRRLTSTTSKMIVVFTTKNIKSDTDWDQNARHGFSASYSFKENLQRDQSESSGGAQELLYGQNAHDQTMNKTKSFYVLKLNTGIPIGNERLQYIYINKDGKVTFSKYGHDSVALAESAGYQQECNKRKRNSVCACCTMIDIASSPNSSVLYNTHDRQSRFKTKTIVPVEEHIKKYRGDNDFHSSIVVVVTWHRVRQLGSKSKKEATFQVAIAASELESYAVIIYQSGSMLWDPPQSGQANIVVGQTKIKDETPECNDEYISRTKKIFTIDEELGNFGKKGVWIYDLGKATSANTVQACEDWFAENSGYVDKRRKSKMRKLPKCPCSSRRKNTTYTTMRSSGKVFKREESIPNEALDWWVKLGKEQSTKQQYDCYRLPKYADKELRPLGKECCYKQDDHELVQNLPHAGSATAFNPSFSRLHKYYLQHDKQGYEDCCLTSNSTEHCRKFYDLRPIGDCEIVQPLVSEVFSDPHMITLDEGEYTFNGWGEYTLMTLKLSRRHSFTLQGRTSLVQTEDGQPIDATVFSAFGAEENGVRVFVGLDPNTNTTFIIYANGQDLSRSFRMNPKFLLDTENFFLRRVDSAVRISFPSGVKLDVSIRLKALALSLSVPLKYKNKTQGLMGNYNGDKTDDFILPNGTKIGQNPTEREIFHTFGAAWAVTTENSVMWYGPEEGPETYAHPEFVPIFLNETPTDIREDAEKVCGKTNMPCIYDFVATGNEEFALDTKTVKEMTDQRNEILKNGIPQLSDIPTIFVTSGKLTTCTLLGKDPDGDAVTYHADFNNTHDAVQLDSDTGIVTYLPEMNTPVNLCFYTMDTKQVRSPSRTIAVVVCSGCNGHGQCDYSTRVSPFEGEFVHSFQHAACNCDPAWTGEHCESQLDGCEEDPCLPGQTCTDLSPEEQGSELKGFDCGPCPKGYAYQPGYMNCMDVNECLDDAHTHDCQMICSNTDGSYKCGCREGYRLNRDGKTCRDVDECREKTARCQQLCHNTDGGYECRCEEGYVLDDSYKTCQPDAAMADACKNAGCSQGCKTDASSGSAECFCFTGYEVDVKAPTRCVDRDECLDDICSQQCFNFKGGFSCVCHSGYMLAEDKVTCTPCKDLTYGPNCQYHCRCSGRAEACHHVTGCVCQRGWRGSQCRDDIDECTEDPNLCGTDQICVNTPGSYKCKCPDGYTKDDNGSCSDIDECAEDSLLNTCLTKTTRRSMVSLHRCVNIPGSFHCKCVDGFTASNDQCVDIDECSLGISDCEQDCTNVPGSFNCKCYYGFRLNVNRTACVKVSDVCAAEEGLTCEHICTMVGGKAACFCRVGYTLNPDQQTCRKEMTCSNKNCSHHCASVDDKPVCSCPDGMVLQNDQTTCEACLAGTYGSDCTLNCSCGLGALDCDVISGCICKDGWMGEKCNIDVNECKNTIVMQECQAKQASCINIPGSYLCKCSKGFVMVDEVCQDIDECRNRLCEQQCENSPGSYRCLCSRGFTMDRKTGACVDLDECALSASNLCTQSCVNVPGSYLCVCDHAGFRLAEDGASCVAIDGCSRTDCPIDDGGCSKEQCFCNSGYQLSGSDTCDRIDIDWCDTVRCEQECQETPDGSSFLCSCGDGYLLNDDRRSCRECPVGFYGKSCAYNCSCGLGSSHCNVTSGCVCKEGWIGEKCDTDFDECNVTLKREDCEKKSAICINTPGSFRCQCRDGFSMNSSEICKDIDECDKSPCEQQCKNVPGSFHCMCNPGFTLDNSTGRNCTDVDECETSPCDQQCENAPGSFLCLCNSGFTLENVTGVNCKDVDECDNNPCEQQCENVPGAYFCLCNPGFILDSSTGVNCTECTAGTYGRNCSMTCDCETENTAFCDSVEGKCTCNAGWEGDTCSDDIDECTTDDVTCPANSECVNTVGRYDCQCRDGLVKQEDGACSECTPGTYGPDCSMTCDCETENTASCDNVGGKCSCKAGWEGDTCSDDINECTTDDVTCPANSECVNTVGRYDCQCGAGFVKQDDGTCSECEPGTYGPECSLTCACVGNTTESCDTVNGTCSCMEGWEGDTCSDDVNECSRDDVSCPPNSYCSNTAGSYVCQCNDGFAQHADGSCIVSGGLARCGGTYKSPRGKIQSPNFPHNYTDSLDCVYIIDAPEKHYIKLSFQAFDTEADFDYLEIQDGGNDASPTFGRFSGEHPPFSLKTSGNQMWIRLKTDSTVTRQGFSATYVSEPSAECGGTWMALTGVIQSPEFPNSFLNQLNCVYVITAPADYYLTLNFTDFDLQVDRDFVEIRDGGSEISPELGRFSESSLPLTVRSTGNQMWIKFVTDDSMATSRFSATYTSAQCGGIWTSPSGTIQSPNFPNNYPNSRNCVYIIIVPHHHHVNLTFTDFDLEPQFDYMQVRDGGSKASPILGGMTNVSVPLTLHSTGNQMWVNFVSDESISRPGFSATYTSGP